jgi:hypothetical protein
MIASSIIPSCVPSIAIAVSASRAKTVLHPPRDAIADTSLHWAGSSSTSINNLVSRSGIHCPPMFMDSRDMANG